MLRFAYAVRVQEVARTLYRELATGQPHVPPMQNLRAPKIVGSKAKNFLLQTSRVFFRLRALLQTEEIAQLALQENEPRFDMLAFRFPSYDREHSVITFLSQLLIF